MEPCPQHGRCECGQLGLHRGAEGVGEPLRRLHDHVDEVATAVQAQLGTLLVEVGNGLHDLRAGVLPHPGTLVQHPVDGGLAQSGLLSDFADLVAVRHRPLPFRACPRRNRRSAGLNSNFRCKASTSASCEEATDERAA